MPANEFVPFSLSLACTVGPFAGLLAFVTWRALRGILASDFEITISNSPGGRYDNK